MRFNTYKSQSVKTEKPSFEKTVYIDMIFKNITAYLKRKGVKKIFFFHEI